MNSRSQSGNVIFMILIFCVLFAALSYAVSQAMRGGDEGSDNQKNDLYATEILSYGNSVNTAVKALLSNGCTDTQITFEQSSNTSYKLNNGGNYNYTNPNAPADKSCNVFDINGGGIIPQKVNSQAVINASGLPTYYQSPDSWSAYSGEFPSVGTDTATASASELLLVVGLLKKDICIRINDKLRINNPGGNPPVDSWAGTLFTGSYGSHSNTIGDTQTDLSGKTAFCATDTSGNYYAYIQVLIAR